MPEYLKQAESFLQKTNTTLKVEFLKNDFYFHKDEDKRDIYKITFTRGKRECSFEIGNSLNNSQYYVESEKLFRHKKYSTTGKSICRKFNDVGENYLKKYCKLVHGTAPNAYDILACLQKYEVGSLEDFCSEFGYDIDSKTAEKIYKAVCKEYEGVCRIWSDKEIEELQEIQ